MSHNEPPVTFTTPMLKAIANPLRRQILDTLSAMETARAADLALTLGIPANKVSFHLRELAKAEMIVEVPELARDKRDRVWKPAARGYTTGEVGERPEDQTGTAMDAYLGQVIHDEQRRLQAALRHAEQHYRGQQPGPVKAQMQTSNLMLTQDEMQELIHRMEEVVPAFREDLKSGKIASAQPVESRQVWHVMSLFTEESLLNESYGEDQTP
ncbi:hypothetical protein CQ017_01460 [Arthrobacter sp. MYb224]|uniref:winged helix-turn-helix domain-containing protein n=1 Tax=Arthrobacter sp. MYb224 TaxID=1848600 RepID=UPI000CFB7927|nr:helix-turn-helix domain-containing protein [Arthrobacter sp. MYb224]PRA01201.1 hypothetical protein CQ017_01460 [Arthrobacter sp. MYb224]